MSYRIELKDQRSKSRQVTFLHLITGFGLTGIGAFTFLLANADWIKTVFHAPLISAWIIGGASLAYGLGLLFFVFTKSKWLKLPANNKVMRLTNMILTLVLLFVFLLSQWWLAAALCGIIGLANLFAYFYEQKLEEALFVTFEAQYISLPATARRRQLEWHEVERVILRHGIITIDCANNFLYQWTVKYNNADSAVLEAFCVQQITANKDKRSEEW
jgi:uncharacterized membrane protein